MTVKEREPKYSRTGGTPKSVEAAHGAAELLAIEGKVRSAANEDELVVLIANELRKLIGARQTIVLRVRSPGQFKIECISSMASVERDAPFVRWIEAICKQLVSEHGDQKALQFELPAFANADDPETRAYPFRYFLWQPMRVASGETFAVVIAAREGPWTESERGIIEREADVFGGTWQALHGGKALLPRARIGKRSRLGLAVAACALALLPVPLVALAPVEIIAARPQRVNAPVDGVIQDILIEPNRPVRAGDIILTFDQTTLRNRFELSEQEMLVAKARLERASQAAFADEKSRHEVAIALAEFELKRAERKYAADLLERSTVVAERGGILVYADKDRWIGRPVKTGERIMQIVDPAAVAAKIELPVADAIVLAQGARVRMFLDSNPLSAVPGKLVSAGYLAEPNAVQQLVYNLHALLDPEADQQRIGARGTAQIQGQFVPLIFYILRRPLSALRQALGL